MRVNLNVKYEERHEAKKHGALWDPRMQVWFVIDPPDMGPITRWLQLTDEQKWRAANALHGSEEARNRRRAIESIYRTTGDVDGPDRSADPAKKRRDSKPGIATPRTEFSLPDCGCTHVAPWDHCHHTEPALDGAELAHIRSI